jgi:hypothetical protein
MASLMDVLIVIGMFALRIGLPVAVVAGLGYLLKRLDRRWETEARAEQAAQPQPQVQEAPAAPARPVRRSGVDVPGPQAPFDPGLIRGPQPGIALSDTRHCWDVKRCSAEKVAQCPAFTHSDLPCWQARTKVEHQMPESCFGCEVFKNYPNI